MIKKRIKFLISMFVVSFSIVGIVGYFFYKPLNHTPCQGVSVYSLNMNDYSYSYQLTYSIYIAENGVGHLTVRGRVTVKNEDYVVNRTINFKYKKLNNGRIRFNPDSVFKSAQDELSDELTKKYFSFFMPGSVNYLIMEMIDDKHMVISGNTRKLFICAYD